MDAARLGFRVTVLKAACRAIDLDGIAATTRASAMRDGRRRRWRTEPWSISRRRVYNHKWKIDPIVRSLIDTDFYKLLMCQSVFRNKPDTTVTFSLINRSKPNPAGRPDRRGRAARAAGPCPHRCRLTRGKAPGCAATRSTASGRCSARISWSGSRALRLPPYHLEKRDGQYELTFEGKLARGHAVGDSGAGGADGTARRAPC